MFKNNNKFYSVILSLKQLKNSKFVFKIKNKYLKIKKHKMAEKNGKVSQVIGPVIDVTFENNENGLPNIYDSLEIKRTDGSTLVLECNNILVRIQVRAISMETTDGISRGTEVVATGAPIKMPTGENIKGRVFNVVGDAIDGMENLDRTMGYQFTEKHQNLKIYPPQLKYFLLE